MPSRKVKINLLFLFFICFTSLLAKSPVIEGDFSVLKKEKNVSFKFTYDQIQLETLALEAVSFNATTSSVDTVQAIESYERIWLNDNRSAEIYFLGTFNRKTKNKLVALNGGDTPYQINVQILSIEPGFYNTIGGSGVKVSAKFVLFDNRTEQEIASVYIPKAQGATEFSLSRRKTSAYTRLAYLFIAQLNKSLK